MMIQTHQTFKWEVKQIRKVSTWQDVAKVYHPWMHNLSSELVSFSVKLEETLWYNLYAVLAIDLGIFLNIVRIQFEHVMTVKVELLIPFILVNNKKYDEIFSLGIPVIINTWFSCLYYTQTFMLKTRLRQKI